MMPPLEPFVYLCVCARVFRYHVDHVDRLLTTNKYKVYPGPNLVRVLRIVEAPCVSFTVKVHNIVVD